MCHIQSASVSITSHTYIQQSQRHHLSIVPQSTLNQYCYEDDLISRSHHISMGAWRHGQEGGGEHLLPRWKCWKVFFFLLQVLSKTSVDEVFMPFWDNVVSLWGLCSKDIHQGDAPGPCWGDFRPSDPVIEHRRKKSSGRPCTDLRHTSDLSLSACQLCRAKQIGSYKYAFVPHKKNG